MVEELQNGALMCRVFVIGIVFVSAEQCASQGAAVRRTTPSMWESVVLIVWEVSIGILWDGVSLLQILC